MFVAGDVFSYPLDSPHRYCRRLIDEYHSCHAQANASLWLTFTCVCVCGGVCDRGFNTGFMYGDGWFKLWAMGNNLQTLSPSLFDLSRRKINDSQESVILFGLKVVLAKLWGVFGLIIPLQYDVKSNYGLNKGSKGAVMGL